MYYSCPIANVPPYRENSLKKMLFDKNGFSVLFNYSLVSTSLVNLSAHYESDKYFKQIFRTLNKLT